MVLILFFPFIILFFLTKWNFFAYGALVMLGLAIIIPFLGMTAGGIGSFTKNGKVTEILWWIIAIAAAVIVTLMLYK